MLQPMSLADIRGVSQFTLCAKCGESPHGIDGHGNLESLAHRVPKPPGASFHCISCGTKWSRHYVGSGVFQWVVEADKG